MDDREPYGRLVHAERLAHNAEREKPFGVEPWERRTAEQRELDMRIAEAVEAAERAKIIALADSVEAVSTGNEGTSCYFADLLRSLP